MPSCRRSPRAEPEPRVAIVRVDANRIVRLARCGRCRRHARRRLPDGYARTERAAGARPPPPLRKRGAQRPLAFFLVIFTTHHGADDFGLASASGACPSSALPGRSTRLHSQRPWHQERRYFRAPSVKLASIPEAPRAMSRRLDTRHRTRCIEPVLDGARRASLGEVALRHFDCVPGAVVRSVGDRSVSPWRE